MGKLWGNKSAAKKRRKTTEVEKGLRNWMYGGGLSDSSEPQKSSANTLTCDRASAHPIMPIDNWSPSSWRDKPIAQVSLSLTLA